MKEFMIDYFPALTLTEYDHIYHEDLLHSY